eukprot:sb/3464233/
MDGNFSRIFNSDTSDNEDFDIPSISGLLETPERRQSPRRVGDPLALSLPTLNTPQHEFGRSPSSDFDRFTSSLDGFASNISGLSSPTLGDALDDIDLKELTKDLHGSPGPAPKTPLNLEGLLDIQCDTEDTVPRGLSDVVRGPLTPPPSISKGSNSPYKTLSSESVDKIVNRLDDLISTNETKVQLSAAKIPSPPAINATVRKRPAPRKPPVLPPKGARIAPKRQLSTLEGTKLGVQNKTLNTLGDLASSLGITEPPPTKPMRCTDPNQILITGPPKPPARAASRQPTIVVGRVNGKVGAPGTRVVPGTRHAIPTLPTTTRHAIPSGKAIVPTKAPLDANKNMVVPYNPPPKKTENKKFVLLPLEKLQNASPALIAQLGLDASLIPGASTKRAPPDPVEGIPEKRTKPTVEEPAGISGGGGGGIEKGKFPINVTLPKGTKEKFRDFQGIPELLEKAKSKSPPHQKVQLFRNGKLYQRLHPAEQ